MTKLLKYSVGKKPFFLKMNGGFISKGVTHKDITYVKLPAGKGRTLSLFYNYKDKLVVGDIVNKGGKSGTEFLRRRI